VSAEGTDHRFSAGCLLSQPTVNATGLGASRVAADPDVYPVRGAVKRIHNQNQDHFEPLTQAYLVPAQKGEDGQPTKVVFLVPRNDETLYVGSIVQPHNDQMVLTEGHPEVEVMFDRARRFLPGLADAKTVVPWFPFAQGLRPFSRKNVEVRADRRTAVPVVHNYGHGGSDWTLAAGTSRSTVHLLEQMLEGKSADQVNDGLYGSSPNRQSKL
jgi:D-amino-acid oxidase